MLLQAITSLCSVQMLGMASVFCDNLNLCEVHQTYIVYITQSVMSAWRKRPSLLKDKKKNTTKNTLCCYLKQCLTGRVLSFRYRIVLFCSLYLISVMLIETCAIKDTIPWLILSNFLFWSHQTQSTAVLSFRSRLFLSGHHWGFRPLPCHLSFIQHHTAQSSGVQQWLSL